MNDFSLRRAALPAVLAALAAAAPLVAQPVYVARRGSACCAFPSTTGGTVSIPINGTVPVGHTLVLSVGMIGASTPSSLSDTQANTWSPIVSTIVLLPPPPRVDMIGTTVHTQLTSADQISLSFSSNAAGATDAAAVVKSSGLAPLPGAVDLSDFATGSGNTAGVTLGGPTTQSSELLVGATVVSGDPGLASILSCTTGGIAACSLYPLTQDHRIVASTGTYGYAWNFPNGVPWGSVLAALKASVVPVELQRMTVE